MPHAENDTTSTPDTMTETMTNGEKPTSQVLNHLTSYPVVSDSISMYLSNPYGAKSVEVANGVYEKFVTPFMPYLATPYSYVAPYVAQVDTLGEIGLEKIDEKFPIVKEETAAIKVKALDVAKLPFTIASSGKSYVFSTYSEQKSKTGVEEKGIISKVLSSGVAVWMTEYKIASDTVSVIAGFLSAKKQEGKKFADAKLNN